MSDQERHVYELIRSHYLAQFLPQHEFDRTQVELECGKERLTAVGKQRAANMPTTTATLLFLPNFIIPFSNTKEAYSYY